MNCRSGLPDPQTTKGLLFSAHGQGYERVIEGSAHWHGRRQMSYASEQKHLKGRETILLVSLVQRMNEGTHFWKDSTGG